MMEVKVEWRGCFAPHTSTFRVKFGDHVVYGVDLRGITARTTEIVEIYNLTIHPYHQHDFGEATAHIKVVAALLKEGYLEC